MVWGLRKREFANRLRDVPSCELSQTRRDGVPSLHLVATQCLAFPLNLPIRLACLLRKVNLSAFNDANKQQRIIMSEPANTPSPVTAAPAASDHKAAPCACAAQPSQPQPASTPATAPAAQKGFKRQARKQH
jgi:hypothetical protein